MQRRLTSTRVLVVAFLALASTGAGQSQKSEGGLMKEAVKDGARDFDFWMGAWKIHNRRLRERLKGSSQWDEFEATSVVRSLLGGVGNEDEYRTDFAGGFIGMSFRFFDRTTQKWSIYWADSRRGSLDPPVVGSFSGDTGIFEGTDSLEGRPVRVRFTWSRVTTNEPRWEQAFSGDGGKTWETNWVMEMTRDAAGESQELQVIELRRYAIKQGQRESFARYFESYFPEAFEQLGAMAYGQFLERKNATWFTWLRGFKDMDARANVNAAFYFGPLWKDHRTVMNDRILDSDNVLLLHPLKPGRGVSLLPAVDPVTDSAGAQGVVVAQIFAVKPGSVLEFAQQAEATFAGYRAAGAHEAGVLVTLDVPNNFPKLPIRTDGPYLVWLGILKDDAMIETRFAPLAERSLQALTATGLLRSAPEQVLLDPTHRSRLRWLPEFETSSGGGGESQQ
jgi:hypothetical protein